MCSYSLQPSILTCFRRVLCSTGWPFFLPFSFLCFNIWYCWSKSVPVILIPYHTSRSILFMRCCHNPSQASLTQVFLLLFLYGNRYPYLLPSLLVTVIAIPTLCITFYLPVSLHNLSILFQIYSLLPFSLFSFKNIL